MFVSGFAWGWLVLWYWLVRPMAKLLGFDSPRAAARSGGEQPDDAR